MGVIVYKPSLKTLPRVLVHKYGSKFPRNSDGLGVLWLDDFTIEKFHHDTNSIDKFYEILRSPRPFILQLRKFRKGEDTIENVPPIDRNGPIVTFHVGNVPTWNDNKASDSLIYNQLLNDKTNDHAGTIAVARQAKGNLFIDFDLENKNPIPFNESAGHWDIPGEVWISEKELE
ncbi:MAG: hypothetical protein LBC33_03325 [Mycoplasmataceae bacterium]|nr:hypothetical protein [Mycoplasmataceae bacterium]